MGFGKRRQHNTEWSAAGADPVLDIPAGNAHLLHPPAGAPRVQPPAGTVVREVLRAREPPLAHPLAGPQRERLVPRLRHDRPVRVLR